MKKILSLPEAVAKSAALRDIGAKVVLCHGVFDLVHLGHVRYFEEAKSHGDELFVSVTADRFIRKGPGRPVFTLQERMEMLSALEIVDVVVASENALCVPLLEALQPRFYVKGPDYAQKEDDKTGGIYKEEDAVRKGGGELVFTTGKKWSSSELIDDYGLVRNSEINTVSTSP